MTICIVSDCCPTGCGVPVVVLQARKTDVVFCYCDLCGCAWSSPGEAQFSSGLNDISGPEKFAPAGADPLPRSRITQSAWLASIIGELPDSDWSVEELNSTIAARAVAQ